MSNRRWIVASALAVFGAAALHSVPAIAHHSSAPFYDATKRVEAQGPVTKFLFKNPHSFLYFANVAVHANDQYQVVFPPSTQFGVHHAKRPVGTHRCAEMTSRRRREPTREVAVCAIQ